jgi:hypothetical protein
VSRHGLERVAAQEQHLGVGCLQRCRDGLHDGRWHCLGGERGLQAFAEAREHRVRLVALPVHQAVRRALEAVPQGSEDHRYNAGGEERNQEVLLHPEEVSEVPDDENVDAEDAEGKGAVDQGAVHEDLYAEEAVAHHRQQDTDGDEDQGGLHHEVTQGAEQEVGNVRIPGGREHHAPEHYPEVGRRAEGER